jgi:UDP-N-acetylglucosamine--N-acetylmuramyl-(pentapeptide) pyrophosphoryl-undecaprenol N-acetylglucosamine transferase
MSNYAVLVAGGTGGHINAAIALGERLSSQHFEVSYLTGQRPLDYKLFAKLPVKHLASWPLRTKNPIKLLSSVARNFLVFLKVFRSFQTKRPHFVVGAGGYVCGPTLLAAKLQGIPVFIFEQNAVLGLTNKLLARLSTVIFTHFRDTLGIPDALSSKVRVVGNPTRSSIAHTPARPPDGNLRVLVFGGSLGATQINDLVCEWVQRDQAGLVTVIHQTGQDQQLKFVAGKNVTYQATKYLDNIQDQYAWCDVLIARAGASTVAELRIVRKPCFLIPFPQATDNHQWWNALKYRDEVDYTVDVVEPRAPRSEMAERLAAFLTMAKEGSLRTSQITPLAVDSGEMALREIFRHVGTIQKN